MLTVMSMGLGVALVVAVLVVYGVVHQSFRRGGEGYDLIVGAKGGREQLVLNTVFYLSQPVGNIPYSVYEDLAQRSDVEVAVPVCMGHTYQGFRVVGTSPDMFNLLKYRGDQKYQFSAGENIKTGEKHHFDAVLGANVAYRTQLDVGEKIEAVHGSGESGVTHKQKFTVVGILAPTGTPVDRAVFVNMLGFDDIHRAESGEHAEETKETKPADKNAKDAKHEDHAHDEHGHCQHGPKEVTAVFVCLVPNRTSPDALASVINRGQATQAVVPVRIIAELFEGIIGKLQWVLLGMAILTVVEAGIGIMVSIYNSMSDRRHEIAVMRALGASRLTVMLIILLESILLSLLGGAFGLLLGHGAIWSCSSLIADYTGVAVGLMQFQLPELILIPGLIVLASAVGYLPAMSAYRTDVAKSLITTP